ncbi:MAG TPA: hypothetical protein VF230_08020 [Acidimicrobiales bacterium]
MIQVRYRRAAFAAVAISSLAIWASTGVSFAGPPSDLDAPGLDRAPGLQRGVEDDAVAPAVEDPSGVQSAAVATADAGPPCPGCVGNATNDPPGQENQDPNGGHECDVQGDPNGGNPGVGDGNPAHPNDCEKTDPEPCPDGKPPAADGSCAQPPHRCPDGSEPPASGPCPETGGTCPDGSSFCPSVDTGPQLPRSCPVDLPLPTGGSCPAPPTTQPQAQAAGASVGPAVQGSVFGRPSEVLGVQQTRTPAAVAPSLARTGGAPIGLALLGLSLCVVGVALARFATYRRYVPQHR